MGTLIVKPVDILVTSGWAGWGVGRGGSFLGVGHFLIDVTVEGLRLEG